MDEELRGRVVTAYRAAMEAQRSTAVVSIHIGTGVLEALEADVPKQSDATSRNTLWGFPCVVEREGALDHISVRTSLTIY